MNQTAGFLLASILLCTTGCSSITHVDSSKHLIVPVASLAARPGEWERVEEELRQGLKVVFVVSKGESVPLDSYVVLPMATLQSAGNTLAFTRDTYLLVSTGSMRISPDGQRWADIDDFAAQKELFGFKSGQVAFGFSASQTAAPKFTLDVQTK